MALPNPRALSLWIVIAAIAIVAGIWYYNRSRGPSSGTLPALTPATTPEAIPDPMGEVAPGDADMPEPDKAAVPAAPESMENAAGETDGIEGEGDGDAPK